MPTPPILQDPHAEDRSPRWWVPVLLASPALIPLATSLLWTWRQGLVATGFIQYDMASYVANAREHFDQGFHLLYGNPYAGYDTPAIYFQPQSLLLGCLQQLGLNPGITFNIFGVAALLFAACVAVRFYCSVVGWRSLAARLGLVCFFWGGGVFTLAGLEYANIERQLNMWTVLHFDVVNGWWVLNFGRSLIYPTEAYYHGVFLLIMLMLIRRRLGIALGLTALLSLSHPFTGLEAVLIVLAYLGVERALGDASIRPMHLAGSAALVVFHLAYYLFFLNRFADHRAMTVQWGFAPPYRPATFVPALFIVGLLAVACWSRWPGWRQLWREPRNRLFLVWFLVVFGLTQHDLVMKPKQPIHFARGYDWTALFFLSAPLLVWVLDRLTKIEPFRLRMLAVSAFMLLFLLDNIVWFGSFLNPHSEISSAIALTKSQEQVLNWLRRSTAPPDMVICSDDKISYLVSAYTRIRSWKGHYANTPSFRERSREVEQVFRDGKVLPVWTTLHVFYIASRDDSGWEPPQNSRKVFHNAQFDIWECPPRTNAATHRLPS
jgi:hypothetical protein